MGTGGQPLYSRDSIAEFQFISNRFDADAGPLVGRAGQRGHQVGNEQAVGSVQRLFRDSDWNAEDHVLGQRLPYHEPAVQHDGRRPDSARPAALLRQLRVRPRRRRPASGTRRIPSFNIDADGHETKKMGGLRLDYQLSPSIAPDGERAPGQSHQSRSDRGGNNNHPASADNEDRNVQRIPGAVDAGVQQQRLNEVKVGYAELQVWIREPDDLVEPLAGGQRHHRRPSAHHLHGFHGRRQPERAAHPRPEHVFGPRRLHLVTTRGVGTT